MRQTWHIFRNDARRLRYEVIAALALTAVYAWLQGHWSPVSTARTVKLNEAANIVRIFVLPMAWWYLASLAVYGEPIPGNRQFWVTRPYRWTSLLGAKLLFLIAFVSFPLLLADCFVMTLQGFHLLGNPAGLFWHEFMIFSVFLLPMIAAASITATLAQAALLGLVAIVPALALRRIFTPDLDVWFQFGSTDGWIVISLIELIAPSAALAILILQYRVRRTRASRVIFGCAAGVLVLLCGRVLPWGTTFTLQSHFLRPRIDTSSITAVFSPDYGRSPGVPGTPPGTVRVVLPIRVVGTPPDITTAVDVMVADLALPNNKSLRKSVWVNGRPPYTVWFPAGIERGLFERLKGTPVRIHLNIYLTVLGNPHIENVPLEGGPYRLAGVGLCERSPGWGSWISFDWLTCWAPFRTPAYVVERSLGIDKKVIWKWHASNYSPLPAEIGINPISGNVWPLPEDAKSLTITTMQPLAHIRRELDIPNVQLADYAD